jgi:WD40 repeat protein
MKNLARIIFSAVLLALFSVSGLQAQEDTTDSWLPENLEVITPENVSRLTELATFGRGQVTAMAWSPDGGTLAIATANGLWLHDTSDWSAPAREITGYEGTIHHIAWHPDGTQLATISIVVSSQLSPSYEPVANEELRVWDLSSVPAFTRTLQSQIGSHTSNRDALVFSPNGAWLASVDDIGISLWNVESGMRRALIYGHDLILPTFSSDSSQLIQADTYFWNIYELTTRHPILGFYDRPFPSDELVTISPRQHGDKVAESLCLDNLDAFRCREREIVVRDSISEEEYVRFSVPYNAYSLTLTPDEKLIIARVCTQTRENATEGPSCIRFETRFLDTDTGEERGELPNFTASFSKNSFSPDSTRLATATDVVRIWDLATYSQTAMLPEYTYGSVSPTFSPNGTLFAAKGNEINIWDVGTGQLRAIIDHGDSVSSIAFSPDGLQLATSGMGDTLRLWNLPDDLAASSEIIIFNPNDAMTLSQNFDSWRQINSVNFSPDGRLLVAAGWGYSDYVSIYGI